MCEALNSRKQDDRRCYKVYSVTKTLTQSSTHPTVINTTHNNEYFSCLLYHFLFPFTFILLCFWFDEDFDEVDFDVLQVLEPSFIEDVTLNMKVFTVLQKNWLFCLVKFC